MVQGLVLHGKATGNDMLNQIDFKQLSTPYGALAYVPQSNCVTADPRGYLQVNQVPLLTTKPQTDFCGARIRDFEERK